MVSKFNCKEQRINVSKVLRLIKYENGFVDIIKRVKLDKGQYTEREVIRHVLSDDSDDIKVIVYEIENVVTTTVKQMREDNE